MNPGDCDEEGERPLARDGINVTKTVLGRRQRLVCIGVLYEAAGTTRGHCAGYCKKQKLYVCGGVMLSASPPLYTTLSLRTEAVKAGPYSSETYSQILQNRKEALRRACLLI